LLLKRTENLNSLNNDGWGPIHIASRKGSVDCINWILTKNETLKAQQREFFDLNLKVIINLKILFT